MFTKAEHKAHHTQTSAQHLSQIQPSFGQTERQDQFVGGSKDSPALSPFISTNSFIQPKLSISTPGDPFEKEADATAEKVMRMPEGNVQLSNRKEEEIQRKEDETVDPSAELSEAPVVQLMADEEQIQKKEDEETLEEDLEPEASIQMKAQESRQEEEKLPPSHSLIHRSAIPSARSQSITSSVSNPTAKGGNNSPTLSRPRYNSMQTMGKAPPTFHTSFQQSLQSTKGSGSTLDSKTGSFMESRFGADFSGVRVHTNVSAIQLASSIGAHAFTHGNDIYFNAGKYRPDSDAGKHLLAHELTHTIQQSASPSIKPFLKTSDQSIHTSAITAPEATTSPEVDDDDVVQPMKIQKADDSIRPELQKAVAYAKSQIGKVNAKEKDKDGKRVGYDRLLNYFRAAMGDDKITATGAPYKTGDVNEEQIIYYSQTKGDVMVPDPKNGGTKMDKRDVMPSWCGIFVFWALNKGGVPMNKWALGKSAVDLKSAYPPKHMPQKGDIAYKGPPYMHYAIVDKAEPEGETNPSKARVTTINGNTAGTDNLGGQVASSTDPVGAWTEKGGFFNPLYGKEEQMPKNPSQITEDEIRQIIEETDALIVSGPKDSESTDAKSAKDTDSKEVSPSSNKVNHELLKPTVAGEEPGQEAPVLEEQKAPESPKTIEEDAEFQKVLQGVGQANKKQKTHDLPETKAAQAQAASKISEELDVNSQAQKNQVGVMNKQQPKPFNAQAFKNQLMDRIKEALPKDDNEAVDRYENPSKQTKAMETAKSDAKGDVKKEKENAGKAISDATTAQPSTEGVEAKEVVDMADEDAGKQPYVPNPETAAPKPRTDEEISMEKDAVELDDQMAKDNVTEEQLEKSNEPSFTGALDNKREAQKEARNAPTEYREKEQPTLQGAEQQSKASVYGKLKEMHEVRSGQFGLVDANKKDTKSKDELKRIEIAEKLQSIYKATKDKVDKALNDLEQTVTDDFDTAATTANKVFEKNVNDRLDDHYGITTVDDTVGDYLRGGLSPEIDRIFQSEKRTFLESMDTAITAISQKVETGLNGAMDIIAAGKVEVDEYWAKLDPETQKIGATAKDEIMGKFSELETSVQEKNDQLVDKLKDRYVKNVESLQETFDKIKDSKKGWLSGAIDAIAGVIKAILQLKDMLFETLARVASVIGDIIDDPIGFLGNLIKAVMMGLDLFRENLPKHLKKGLIEWIMGAMPPGIVLPEVWDLKGIFGFVMQVLGLTWANIRQRAVLKLGEPTVAALETTFEIFQIILKEGIGGLWKFIMDKVGNLQVLIMDTIKNFLIEKIITAGIEWIIGLLNPAAAFIKACKLIYSIVMFFVERGKQIMALVNAVIDSVENIVKGDLVGAAKMVETALAKLIPVTIGFLAALLGLNGITAEVQKIIKKIQAPINKAIDWVIDKAIALAKKLGIDKIVKKVKGKVEDTKKWAKDKVEKGKAAGKKAVAKVLNWLGIKKEFKSTDGEHHSLYIKGSETNAGVYVASANPRLVPEFISYITPIVNTKGDAAQKGALSGVIPLNTRVNELRISLGKKDNLNREAEKNEMEAKMGAMTPHLGILMSMSSVPQPPALVKPAFGNGTKASSFEVQYLKLDRTDGGSDASKSDGKTLLGWNALKTAGLTNNSAWVKMHLLTEQLGGPAVDANLTPARGQEANLVFYRDLEQHAISDVSKNYVIWYKVTIGYHGSPHDHYPNRVRMEYGPYDYENNAWVKKAEGASAKNMNSVAAPIGKHKDMGPPQLDPPNATAPTGPPSINLMSRADIRTMFDGVVGVDKIFDVRNTLPNREYKSLINMYFRLKEAFNSSQAFEKTYWPIISNKYNFQNAFIF